MKNIIKAVHRKEWRLIGKQGRVDQSEHRYYSNGADHITEEPNDKWQREVQIDGNIQKNNISRKVQFEELLEDSRSKLIKSNFATGNTWNVGKNTWIEIMWSNVTCVIA